MYIIGGTFKHHRLITPKGNQTRPTASKLRQALFNICQNFIEDARFLDLFAGSGAMGLEALSRGACTATFVDASKEAIRCIKHNIAHLKVEQTCEVFCGQVPTLLKFLEKQHKKYDLIYADPPYNTRIEFAGQTLLYSEYVVNYVDASALLVPGGTLFIEEDARFPPQSTPLTLALKDSRKFGHSLLQTYQKSF